nr:C514 [uncultured bacterium]ART37844.1 F451 [uncultured bacterium]
MAAVFSDIASVPDARRRCGWVQGRAHCACACCRMNRNRLAGNAKMARNGRRPTRACNPSGACHVEPDARIQA